MLFTSKIFAALLLGASIVAAEPLCSENDNAYSCKVDSDCPTAGDQCCLLAVSRDFFSAVLLRPSIECRLLSTSPLAIPPVGALVRAAVTVPLLEGYVRSYDLSYST